MATTQEPGRGGFALNLGAFLSRDEQKQWDGAMGNRRVVVAATGTPIWDNLVRQHIPRPSPFANRRVPGMGLTEVDRAIMGPPEPEQNDRSEAEANLLAKIIQGLREV